MSKGIRNHDESPQHFRYPSGSWDNQPSHFFYHHLCGGNTSCFITVWASGRPFWRVREFDCVLGARFHAAVFLDGPFLSLPLFPLISIADGRRRRASGLLRRSAAWLLDLLHLATQRLCPSLPPSLPPCTPGPIPLSSVRLGRLPLSLSLHSFPL